jgi:hypothetical protein
MSTAASWRVRSSVVDFVRELGHSVVLKRDSMEKSVHLIREVRGDDFVTGFFVHVNASPSASSSCGEPECFDHSFGPLIESSMHK